MSNKKYIISIILALIVALMIIPTSFAEDTFQVTASDSGEPPALPDGENPPSMPGNGTMPPMGDGNQPPEMPNGTVPPDMENGTQPPVAPGEDTGKSVLSANNLTKIYGGSEKFEVNFVDANGNPISGQHLSINLTRTSSGASKTYDVTTDYTGLATLPIELAPGFYTAYTTYIAVEGLNYTDANIFNTITVKSEEEANTISTVLTAEALTKVYGTSDNFTVTLKDSEGVVIAGQHIAITLTRTSSGASKTYDTTTDYNGIASLEINLGEGSYTAGAVFTGQGDYSGSSAYTTITVTSASEDDNTNPPEIPENGTQHGNGTVPPDMPGNGTTPPDMPNGTGPGNGTTPPDMPGDNTNPGDTTNSSSDVETNITGERLVVSGSEESVNSGTYSSSNSDENTVLVTNGGSLTLSNAEIRKTGDVSNSNSEDSDFYGTNAAVLVQAQSTLNIGDTNIVTNATGANAIFVTNTQSSQSGATAYVSNVNIDTYKDKSRGLDATYGGIIIADNVTINTRGGSCAAVATDRGEGTVTVSNSVLNTGVDSNTRGTGSPVIYSTGAITVTDSTGTAHQAQIGCIEGKNSITLVNCDLAGYGTGNRAVNGEYVDLGGFFIYQSMSGDADVGTATLNATNSILTIPTDSTYYTTAPMFHVTNTAAIINLNNCTLNFGSGILLDVSGQSQWGTTGSNGGQLTFTATNQELSGNIEIDSISSLSLTLIDSNYSGSINPTGTYGTTNLNIASGSTWTLTGNSYLTSLTNAGTINYGSYILYVNGVAYTSSNPYTS